MNRALAAAALAVTAASCTTGWSRRGVPDIEGLPSAYAADGAAQSPETGASSAHAWWHAFGDPTLDHAVEAVLSENLTLASAVHRVAQAEAARQAAGASRFPSFDGTLQAARARTNSPLGATTQNAYTASVSAAYEVDVWGRARAARDAAQLDYEAALADTNAMRVTLAANAVERWLDGTYAQARADLLASQLDTQSRLLEVVLIRLRSNLATALDVEQQRQQVMLIEELRVLTDASARSAALQLSALQGRVAADVDFGAALPTLPPTPSVGVPADLVTQRPDVQAAYLRAEAADARIAQAIAARLPALRLAARISLESTSLSDLFDQLLWSVAASLTGPIFDGGARRAEVQRTRAAFDGAIIDYANALVTAATEVEIALTLEDAQRRYVTDLEARAETARRTVDLANEQYREGVVDYFRVLSVHAALQQAEQAVLDAKRQQIAYRIQLHRALGGGLGETQPTDEETR